MPAVALAAKGLSIPAADVYHALLSACAGVRERPLPSLFGDPDPSGSR